MQPNTHSSAPYCTKFEENLEDIVLWRSEPQVEAVQFRYVTAGIVGLDRSKQSSPAAMANLYRVGHASYRRTSLSLGTRESPVLPPELGSTSCCFGTESAFQHWGKQSVSNTRGDPGGKYGRTSSPKRVLPWVVAHLPSRSMHEVPELRGASILIEICFELAGGALSRSVHFVSRHALRWLQGKT